MQRFPFHNTLPSLISYSARPPASPALSAKALLQTGLPRSEAPRLSGCPPPGLTQPSGGLCSALQLLVMLTGRTIFLTWGVAQSCFLACFAPTSPVASRNAKDTISTGWLGACGGEIPPAPEVCAHTASGDPHSTYVWLLRLPVCGQPRCRVATELRVMSCLAPGHWLNSGRMESQMLWFQVSFLSTHHGVSHMKRSCPPRRHSRMDPPP